MGEGRGGALKGLCDFWSHLCVLKQHTFRLNTNTNYVLFPVLKVRTFLIRIDDTTVDKETTSQVQFLMREEFDLQL